MSLSRAEIELLVEEIAPAVHHAAIQRVLEVDEHTFILRLRRPGENLMLLVSTREALTRMHFVTQRERQPEQPSHFTMLLRKWLDGSIIEDLHQFERDRIVEIRARIVDPNWTPTEDFVGPAPRTTAYLVIELTGKMANVYLLDKQRIVRGMQPGNARDDRELRVGAHYRAPALPPVSDDNIIERTGKKPASERVRWQLDTLPATERVRSLQVENAYADLGQTDRLERDTRELRARIRQRQKMLSTRIKKIESDLQKVENSEQYRRWGELLQASFNQIKRGASSALVTDYYQEDMPKIEIPLDPARPLQHNIARYFHQYKRFKDAASRIEDRLLETLDELDQLTDALARLDACETPEAIQQLAGELREKRLLSGPRQQSGPRGAQNAAPRLPYREFRARSGAQILVGRGAKHNDALTTKVARGRDIWMHARDWTGAHVVLRMNSVQPPRSEDLIDAAMLAAYFSRGKDDSIIDVTYAEAKHVRKPRGAAPGTVTIAGGSTLAITIDPDRLSRLLENEVQAT